MSQNEDDILSDHESADVAAILDDLVRLEGTYAFGCGHCDQVFDTVVELGQHSLAQHSGKLLLIDPLRKQ
jgi:hypothetical protein